MSLTESTMMELGSRAPDFKLKSTEGEYVTLKDFDKAEVLVVLFICNHCPYVIHIALALAELANRYEPLTVGFVAINSNDANAYPEDDFAHMQQEKANRAYTFPYLFDETQETAKAYGAACTPDIFVFDKSRNLAYRGQFDATRPHRISSGNYDASNGEASGSDLKAAIDELLHGNSAPEPQIPSMGCNIKWRPGNEPDYFA